jgi:hypothetical protein
LNVPQFPALPQVTDQVAPPFVEESLVMFTERFAVLPTCNVEGAPLIGDIETTGTEMVTVAATVILS